MRYLYWDLVLNNPKRIEIYLSGCLASHCKNCHNPESWEFNEGFRVDEILINNIKKYEQYFNDIWILGGEPLDQVKDDLIWLLDRLKETNKNIWLWTRYEFNEIHLDILEYCDYVKCGKYIDTNSSYMTEYGFELASSNQRIFKL